jgi:RNA polymerase sigma factor (sigma-70 family)
MARYGALRAFAARLVGTDWSLLEDLIQDAYVQFTTAQPDLAQIRDLDAYLATLVRNLHVSSVRRAVNHRTRHVAIEDYDSALLALDASSSEEQLRARDALIRICQFACVRKQTSKAASAFVLRFFHDVYPSDIARILRTTPATVHTWVSQARREARQHLADPPRVRTTDDLVAPQDTIAHLRTAISATAQPPCLTSRAIAEWKSADRAKALDVATCAHIASCGRCLERLYAQLEPSSDSGPRPPDSEGGGAGGGVTSSGSSTFHDKARRRARGLREHRPQQLEISINGHHVGILRVTSSQNEVSWTVRIDEPVAFAELHSEQGIRMWLLHVELPPQGALIQEVRVALSDDRSLRLTLDFSELRPVIVVEYLDPALEPAVVKQESEDPLAPRVPDSTASGVDAQSAPGRSWWRRVWDSWRHPARLVPMAGTLFLLAATLWWTHGRSPAVPSAAVLIEQAVAREAGATSTSEAVYRTLTFHVQREDAQAPASTHRIEAWTRGDTRMRAVRVFDQTGHLVSGRWQIEGREDLIELGLFDDVWVADLSADSFRERYMAQAACASAATGAERTVTCLRAESAAWRRWFDPVVLAQSVRTVPVRAVLTLRAADLHAIRMELTVRSGGVDHAVLLEETSLRRVQIAEVPEGVFSPEAEASPRVPGIVAPPVAPLVAPLWAEVLALEIADRFSDMDALAVSRDSRGVVVSGLVTTSSRKAAVVGALSSLGPAVTSEIRTFSEAFADPAPASAAATRAEVHALPSGPAPLERWLTDRLGSGAPAVVANLAPPMLEASGRLRRNVVALAGVFDRVSAADVATLDPRARQAWHAMVSRRAAAALSALATLDELLAPYSPDPGAAPAPADSASADVMQRISRDAAAIDASVARAVSASSGTGEDDGPETLTAIRSRIHQTQIDLRRLHADPLR